MLSQDGLIYPVWDFNGIDISATLQGKSIDLWLDVNGVVTHATRWTVSPPTTPTPIPTPSATPVPSDQGGDTTATDTPVPTPTPQLTWQQRPTSSCQ
jgi:hypothetical protein